MESVHDLTVFNRHCVETYLAGSPSEIILPGCVMIIAVEFKGKQNCVSCAELEIRRRFRNIGRIFPRIKTGAALHLKHYHATSNGMLRDILLDIYNFCQGCNRTLLYFIQERRSHECFLSSSQARAEFDSFVIDLRKYYGNWAPHRTRPRLPLEFYFNYIREHPTPQNING